MHWIYTKIQKNSNHSTGKMWVLQLLLVVCWSDSNLKKDAFKANTAKRMIWRNNTGFCWKPNETFAKNPISPALTHWIFVTKCPPAATNADTGPKDQKPTAVAVLKATCQQSGVLWWILRGEGATWWPILPFKTIGKLKRVESSFHSCIYSLENWKVPEFFHQKLISGILLGVLPLSVRAANEAIGIRC